MVGRDQAAKLDFRRAISSSIVSILAINRAFASSARGKNNHVIEIRATSKHYYNMFSRVNGENQRI